LYIVCFALYSIFTLCTVNERRCIQIFTFTFEFYFFSGCSAEKESKRLKSARPDPNIGTASAMPYLDFVERLTSHSHVSQSFFSDMRMQMVLTQCHIWILLNA
jgi:hypothetical protein